MKQFMYLTALVLIISCTNAQRTDNTTSEVSNISKDVDVNAFKQLIKEKGDAIILDVRTQEEVDAGMIVGAKNINFFADDFKQQVEKLDKNKPVLVYCAVGGRSGKAMKLMSKMGFIEVYNLSGGYNAWIASEK